MTFPLPALRCWKQILHTFANWSVQWQSWQTRYGCRHRIHNDHKPYFLPVAVVLETMVQKTKCWRLWCWNIKLLIRKTKCRCEIMMHTHINNRAGNFGLMLLQTMDLQTSQLIHTVCLLQCLYIQWIVKDWKTQVMPRTTHTHVKWYYIQTFQACWQLHFQLPIASLEACPMGSCCPY